MRAAAANQFAQWWHQWVLGHTIGSSWTAPDGRECIVCGCWQAQWTRKADSNASIW